MNTSKTLYGDVQPGDWVIAAGNNDYRYLIGTVTAIDKLGTEEHGTDNETDDIHVDFTAFNYPPDRIEEIEEHFSGLYGELKTFDNIALDDVIMAPKMLIRISHLGQDEITFMGNLRQNCESFCNSFMGGGSEPKSSREIELIERIEKNYADYKKSLLGFGKQELIDMAGKISAMSDAHSYMTCWHGFDEHELDYLLEFQNPLEVLADEWRERQIDLSDMSFAMEHIYQESDALLEQYPVIHDSEAPADLDLRRFMGVDLVDFLGKISEKTIIHYPNDWNIDIDELRRYSMFEDFDERRLVWHVCSMGTHLKPERDVFIRDSGSYEYMTDYHQNDADMLGYYVEITDTEGQRIIGNVFEVGNYADFASHLRLTALPLDSVTLTYSPDWGGVNAGKVLTVSRNEYDNDRHRLMSQSGRVTELTFHPKDAQELYKILRDERVYRMSFPIGSQEEHLKKVDAILAEARTPPEAEQITTDLTHGFNGEIRPGDWVVVMPVETFSGLVGQVQEIVTSDSPKHTGFPCDEVHVNFTKSGYTDEQAREIVCGVLDDDEFRTGYVITEANALINITGIDPAIRQSLIESQETAGAYCRQVIDNVQHAQRHVERSEKAEKAGRPTAKPKTLADKLQAGKAKAEAYKAQNPQTTTKTKKKEID